jgi:molybdenum cofactor guanylyltransferase
MMPVGGRPLLLRVLDAAEAARSRIVVGPPALAPLLPPGVELVQEEPAGGGPVAGLAAGVRLVPPGVRRVAVLSADLPFLTAAVLGGVSTQLDGGGDVAVLQDDSGRPQWLCAVWHAPALAERLAALGEPSGARMGDLFRSAAVITVPVLERSGPPPWFDCDTEEDFRRAEELLHDSR